MAFLEQQDLGAAQLFQREQGKIVDLFVGTRRSKHERILRDGAVFQRAQSVFHWLRFQCQKHGVEFGAAKALDQHAGFFLNPVGLQLRIGATKRGRQPGEQVRRNGRDHAELNLAAKWTCRARGFGFKIRCVAEQGTGTFQDRPPSGCDEHMLAVTLEQLNPEILLQLGDLRAERGLRDVASLGCLAEAERIGDRNRVLQLAQRKRMWL